MADEPCGPAGWPRRSLLTESRPQATRQVLSRRGPGHGEVLVSDMMISWEAPGDRPDRARCCSPYAKDRFA